MKKWTALSLVNEDLRWQAMSLAIRDAGIENEYVPFAGNVEELKDLSSLQGFDHVRISSRLVEQITKLLKVQSSWTTLLGVVDGMNYINGSWWPLCALYEGFGQLLIDLGQDLDKRGSVFIAGVGGTARAAIAAFFKAGFQNFLVTNFSEPLAQEMIAEVRARFFGMTIQWVAMEKIVLLPGESSVLVNCTPGTEENALLTELSYMNFLQRPGCLFDVSRASTPSVLVQEATDAGARVVSGLDLAARTDVLWAKWGFQANVPLESYRERLSVAFQKA